MVRAGTPLTILVLLVAVRTSALAAGAPPELVATLVGERERAYNYVRAVKTFWSPSFTRYLEVRAEYDELRASYMSCIAGVKATIISGAENAIKPNGAVYRLRKESEDKAGRFVAEAREAWVNQKKGPLRFILGDLIDVVTKVVNAILDARKMYAEGEQAWQKFRTDAAEGFERDVRWNTWENVP